jgi:Zn-dependent peptidase ImmA (M78 family)
MVQLENLLGLKRRWKDIQKNYEKSDFSSRGFELSDQLGTEIRNTLNLGSRPASSLLSVLENDLRFKVLHVQLDKGISGACVVDDRLGVGILINANDAPWRRNFDLAHELFHIVTWNVFSAKEVGDGTIKTRPEKYADIFASSLLLPKKHLLATLNEISASSGFRFVDMIELAKEFGVSTEAVLWRLVNLKVLKRESVLKALDDPRRKELDRSLRKHIQPQSIDNKYPEKFISLCCRCLMEGRISRGVFAKYLELDRTEIDDFLDKYGFMEKNYEEIASA